MRSHTIPSSFRSSPSSLLSLSALVPLLLTFSSPATAFECSAISASGSQFNFKPLGGPRIVEWAEEPDLEHEKQYKYNFTLDLCNTLKWHKDGSAATECHHGTQICAIREEVDLTGIHNSTIQPIEIAGTYSAGGNGRTIDAHFELLKNSKSHSDATREGVRAELHGGRFPYDDKKNGLDQQAIIEFVCDQDRTGLEEGEEDNGEKEDGDGKDEGDKDGNEKNDKLQQRDGNKCQGDDKKSLRFCGYEKEEVGKDKKQVKVLRLEWRTKYACENASDDTPSSHWGFFTWFIIILFLATAAYLIFGSWLNYNRYGARGWDLLPHGDTIRDIPYILKDWARRVKDTVSGPGSRGGYAAV